ncbi:hypothetical protein FRD01_12995 [Microvenator marinus]|uniref:DUF4276 family protein n=1 Tax=Microvenator marinus TaxID=2600177 RepID=A0A5B8XS94_9DELT|nr:DUF4276 family protein [Microvenator marinus]QED28131.1 hypothetical protein FRD01_12995 [Microvenator marinus]
MTRVYVICEGQTEELFVKDVLWMQFFAQGIDLRPCLIGKPGHKGGNFKIERLVADLRSTLRSDANAYCTTFFDFYGLPESFPGKKESYSKGTSADKSACLFSREVALRIVFTCPNCARSVWLLQAQISPRFTD